MTSSSSITTGYWAAVPAGGGTNSINSQLMSLKKKVYAFRGLDIEAKKN